MIRFRSFAWLLVMTVPLTLLAADELDSVSIGDVDVEVTKAQALKINAIWERNLADLEAKRDAATDNKKAHQTLAAQMISEGEALLTPAQLEELRKARRETYLEKSKNSARFLREFGDAAQIVADSTSFTLYAGLPRAKPEDLEKIKAEIKTVTVEKFDFYAQPLHISPAQQLAWQELISDYQNFHPYGGEKFCGSFHPDLLLEFNSKDGMLRALICFGCHEVKFIGPQGSFMVDIDYVRYEAIVRAANASRGERKKEQ